MKNIDILYEDADCVVLNKPAGLAVQGGDRITTSLDNLLAEIWHQRPFLVHRLDKDTSGVMLVAKSKEAARYYSMVISSKRVKKKYLALCNGIIHPSKGKIDEPLEIHGTKKASLTLYKQIIHSEQISLVELQLGSGRMHQIRRHLALIGNPILGDDKYGDFALNKLLKKERGIKRLMLHAWELTIPILVLQKTIAITAPMPDYFISFLECEFGSQIFPTLGSCE
ncbi:RluA family pseudouridine synthase [Gracilinema caldarium]|uniref:Pseudouridine synthase n=1 Tax=Gracilinema caldarium (strain ATCC 51460 / DSM 7334 / H1) TaxID=744872 RepID=F8EXH0_GRAC1|nr:RluA family pseudouridine synthase [Gracilinema caldarium]AEJ19197.1 pseudouridine synthase [Gracilinema caldarium DSM 7334]